MPINNKKILSSDIELRLTNKRSQRKGSRSSPISVSTWTALSPGPFNEGQMELEIFKWNDAKGMRLTEYLCKKVLFINVNIHINSMKHINKSRGVLNELVQRDALKFNSPSQTVLKKWEKTWRITDSYFNGSTRPRKPHKKGCSCHPIAVRCNAINVKPRQIFYPLKISMSWWFDQLKWWYNRLTYGTYNTYQISYLLLRHFPSWNFMIKQSQL